MKDVKVGDGHRVGFKQTTSRQKCPLLVRWQMLKSIANAILDGRQANILSICFAHGGSASNHPTNGRQVT